MSAVTRQSNTPKTGLYTQQTDVGETYTALDQLPARIRRRLADATLPIDPISLLAYYRKGIDGGYDPEFVEAKVIEAIENTEILARENLDRERATWTLGEDMAASMK